MFYTEIQKKFIHCRYLSDVEKSVKSYSKKETYECQETQIHSGQQNTTREGGDIIPIPVLYFSECWQRNSRPQ